MSWLSESRGESPAGLAGVASEFMYESGGFKTGTEPADRVDVEYDDGDSDDIPRTVIELYAESEGTELDACARSAAGDRAGCE